MRIVRRRCTTGASRRRSLAHPEASQWFEWFETAGEWFEITGVRGGKRNDTKGF